MRIHTYRLLIFSAARSEDSAWCARCFTQGAPSDPGCGRPNSITYDWESSCKGVKIFYQDGRGKTFSTSLEVGRNKSWAETTCYKSDNCPFVPFGIERASQDRTNPWPTGVPLDDSKGALPSRPSPSPPQKPSNNQQSSRELTSIGRRAQCGVITADHRTLIRGRVSLIEWAGTVTHRFDANSGRWQQGAETAASSH